MKKKSLLLTCAALLAVMIMLLCGCSSYGGIKASYENAGFTESELTEAIQSDLMKAINAGSEEEIEQVPVKMLVPLGTLIVPAMFLAILGPLLGSVAVG